MSLFSQQLLQADGPRHPLHGINDKHSVMAATRAHGPDQRAAVWLSIAGGSHLFGDNPALHFSSPTQATRTTQKVSKTFLNNCALIQNLETFPFQETLKLFQLLCWLKGAPTSRPCGAGCYYESTLYSTHQHRDSACGQTLFGWLTRATVPQILSASKSSTNETCFVLHKYP